MKDVTVADVRNFVLLGHSGSGKTTLTDAMLFKMGVNDRQGSVDNGSSMADYTDEEKSRKITIYAKPFSGVHASGGRKTAMVFCDTPGFADFFGQVILAGRIANAAVVVVDANAGVQVGTARGWKQADQLELPRAVVVTGLDRENASFARVLAELQEKWGARCVPVTLPAAGGNGVVDVLSSAAPAPDVAEAVQAAKGSLVELAAETDDTLIEKYLAGEPLSADELAAGLRRAVLERKLVPVFACLPPKGVGIQEFLDGVARLFPSPLDRPIKDAEGRPINPAADAPFVGFIWRMVNDPFIGQLAFLYVCGGTLKPDMDILNATKDQKERIAVLGEFNGKKQGTVESACAGQIVALSKLKFTGLGDTLCAAAHKTLLAPFKFPNPVAWAAIAAKTQGDEDKIGVALQRVAEEDPTIKVERSKDTHEMVLSGMGDTHIAVTVEKMKRRSNVDVTLSTPKVPYKETVTAKGEGHYKHKKQSGGRGQFGEVYLRVDPLPPGETEWFVDAIVGGAIPGNFLPAVQKGLVEGMSRGCVAGYPVVNVRVTVYDGSYHEVDSSEISFKIAGSRAFRDGMSKAKPVLLEPIMTVRVMVPDQFMGDVNGDLSHKRGRIMGMETADGMQVIVAEAPQAELFHYCAELRSMTGGRGTFEMEFNRYEVVPSNVAQKVIAEAEKNKKEEEE